MVSHEVMLQNKAVRQLDRTLQQRDDDGRFDANAFTLAAAPYTIGYAINGFLESGLLFGDERYLCAARKAARAVANMHCNAI